MVHAEVVRLVGGLEQRKPLRLRVRPTGDRPANTAPQEQVADNWANSNAYADPSVPRSFVRQCEGILSIYIYRDA